MPLPDAPVELEFRDGVQVVPNHLQHLFALAGIDTTHYTFEEAVRATNNAVLENKLNDAMNTLIGNHFRDNR